MKKLLFVFIVIFFISGCSAIDSIKLGGGYTGEDGTKVEGDVEVVLSKDSSYVGMDVLESVENPDDKYIVIGKSQADRIVNKLEPEKKGVLSISSFKKLSEFLRKK